MIIETAAVRAAFFVLFPQFFGKNYKGNCRKSKQNDYIKRNARLSEQFSRDNAERAAAYENRAVRELSVRRMERRLGARDVKTRVSERENEYFGVCSRQRVDRKGPEAENEKNKPDKPERDARKSVFEPSDYRLRQKRYGVVEKRYRPQKITVADNARKSGVAHDFEHRVHVKIHVSGAYSGRA